MDNQQKKKGMQKLIHKSYFVELFRLNILVKEFFYFYEEKTVLGSRYLKMANSTDGSNVTFSSILNLVPLFLEENRKFFLPK